MDIKDNNILKTLQNIFFEYSEKKEETSKLNIFKMLFEYKMIDVCDYNIIYVNYYLNKLNEEDNISFAQFLHLVFFIYGQQLKMLNQGNPENQTSMSEGDQLPNEIHNMSSNSIKYIVENRKMIYSSNNIVRVLLDQREKGERFMELCCPLFSKNTQLLETLLNQELIFYISNYTNDLMSIFLANSKFDEEKNVQYMNIADLISIIWNHHIYSNFDCDSIALIVSMFLYPYEVKVDQKFKTIFDEPMNKKNPELVKEEFNKIYLNSDNLNFTFSTFILLLSAFGLNLNDNKDKEPIPSLEFFFKNIMELRENRSQEEMEVIDKSATIVEEEDHFPESKIYLQALEIQKNPTNQEADFIQDCLFMLEKDLPDLGSFIKDHQNPVPNQANALYANPKMIEKLKFPLGQLQVEIDEENKRKIEKKDKAMIEGAKKVKRPNPRDPPVKPVFREEFPNKEFERLKYFGNATIDNLKNRLMKNTMKEVLANSHVYPSLIREVMIIPKAVPKEVVETIMMSLRDQIAGNYEIAIRKLERAEYEFNLFKIHNSQVELFFNFMFGNIYESLELNLMAMKYYLKAKAIGDKLYVTDPDNAIVYCNFGSLMITLREYEWALKCFLRAKDIRENTIGGDTLDTATVYNNLGVCCFHLQMWYPALGFFELAYSLYKKHLG
jgi:tetratricopeptide (TPR) repeat protein